MEDAIQDALSIPILLSILRINNSLGNIGFFSPNRDKKLDQGFDRKSNSTIELSRRFPFD